MCTVRNTHAGQIEAVQQYTDLFQSEVYVRKFLKETYVLSSPSSSTVRGLISIITRFLQINPNNRMRAEDCLAHPFFVTKSTGREKENDCFKDPKYELPLVVEDALEKSLIEAGGNSDTFTVCINPILLLYIYGVYLGLVNIEPICYIFRFDRKISIRFRSIRFFFSIGYTG